MYENYVPTDRKVVVFSENGLDYFCTRNFMLNDCDFVRINGYNNNATERTCKFNLHIDITGLSPNHYNQIYYVYCVLFF